MEILKRLFGDFRFLILCRVLSLVVLFNVGASYAEQENANADRRGNLQVRFHNGLVIENFASGERDNYLNPDEASRAVTLLAWILPTGFMGTLIRLHGLIILRYGCMAIPSMECEALKLIAMIIPN